MRIQTRIKNIVTRTGIAVVLIASALFVSSPALAHAASSNCDKTSFIGFPSWSKYLDKKEISQEVKKGQTVKICQPILNDINDTWLIVAAIIEILLRLIAMISVGFIIWGGIQLSMSQGDPGGIKNARETIQNALIGLIIAILATVSVSFIAGRFN